jgi:hypothetical protein
VSGQIQRGTQLTQQLDASTFVHRPDIIFATSIPQSNYPGQLGWYFSLNRRHVAGLPVCVSGQIQRENQLMQQLHASSIDHSSLSSPTRFSIHLHQHIGLGQSLNRRHVAGMPVCVSGQIQRWIHPSTIIASHNNIH